MTDEPRLVKSPHGATFAGHPPEESALALPGARDARDSWLAANRIAHRRAAAAEYARVELEQLRRDHVALPILLDAAQLARHRERLAVNAEAAAFAAIRRFDRIVNPPNQARQLTPESTGNQAGQHRKEQPH